MTDLTRRQVFKAVFGAAATVALAKTTALKLGLPLLTEIEFDKFYDEGLYRIIGRYNGPGPHSGERIYLIMYGYPEMLEDARYDECMFEACYDGLTEYVLEEALA